MNLLTIRHVTRYRYAKPVWFGEHTMMFRPRESFDQHVIRNDLRISPEPTYLRCHHDVFGNCVGVARFGARAAELSFESTVLLEHTPELSLDQPSTSRLNSYPFAYANSDLPDVHSSMMRLYPDSGGQIASWSKSFLQNLKKVDAINVLTAMTHGVHRDFKYVSRRWGPPQSPLETLCQREGTCRDFAVLFMEGARALGLAARFVSGYIFIPKHTNSSDRQGGANTHAWVRVFLPTGGWIEFDPTNGLVGNRDLIRVAVVRDPYQAITLSGTWEGDAADYRGMDVHVDVESQPLPQGREIAR
ncbi:MAG TPA: transglutaminase family protein [Rhizomicrobium sp.]